MSVICSSMTLRASAMTGLLRSPPSGRLRLLGLVLIDDVRLSPFDPEGCSGLGGSGEATSFVGVVVPSRGRDWALEE